MIPTNNFQNDSSLNQFVRGGVTQVQIVNSRMVIPKALPFYLYLPSLKIRESNRFNISTMNKIINVPEWLEENKVALSTPPVCNELMHFGQLIIMFVGGGNIREDFHINEGEELFYQLKGEMLLVIEEAGRDVSYESNVTLVLACDAKRRTVTG